MSASALAARATADPVTHQVRVLVLDDEDLVHWGFRVLLSNEGWAERCLPARTLECALRLARRFQPHVAIIDIGLLGSAPQAVCRRLLEESPRTRLLVLSTPDSVSPSTIRAYGADGYISRGWDARALLHAIRMTSAGLRPVSSRSSEDAVLSARQQEILHFIAAGDTNAEIATRLYLSRHTVKQHTSALYRKLGVRNRTHAVQAAQSRGLIAV